MVQPRRRLVCFEFRTFPALPSRLDFGSWNQTFNSLLRWFFQNNTHELRKWFGSFTNNFSQTFLPSVYGNLTSPQRIGSGDSYSPVSSFTPSMVVLANNGYEYTTPFGVYDLQPLLGGRDYYISYRTSDMNVNSNVAHAGFILQEDSSGSWQLMSGVSTNPTVAASSNQFQSTWIVTRNSVTVAQLTLIVAFMANVVPKVSVVISRTPDWVNQGLKDYRWVWVTIPSVGYDTFTYYDTFTTDCTPQTDSNGNQMTDTNGNPLFLHATYQQCVGYVQPIHTVTLSQMTAEQNDFSAGFLSRASFVGLKGWHSDWGQQGVKNVRLILSNQLTNSPAIVTIFDTNLANIDPSIATDTSCTASGASAASINCSLNHAANVLILVFATIDNLSNTGGTVSSITIGGFSANSVSSNGSTTTIQAYYYFLWLPYRQMILWL